MFGDNIPELASVIFLAEEKSPVVCKIPPLKVIEPEAFPKLLSAPMLNVPSLITVPPK